MPKDDKAKKSTKFKPYLGLTSAVKTEPVSAVRSAIPEIVTTDLDAIKDGEDVTSSDIGTSYDEVPEKAIFYERDLRRRKSVEFVSELEGARRLLCPQYVAIAAKKLPSGTVVTADGRKVEIVYESSLRKDPDIRFISLLEETVMLLPPEVAIDYPEFKNKN